MDEIEETLDRMQEDLDRMRRTDTEQRLLDSPETLQRIRASVTDPSTRVRRERPVHLTEAESAVERQKVQAVLDRWSIETIREVASTIRETRALHPADATCECEAMDALKVVLAAEHVKPSWPSARLREERDELDRQLRDAREEIARIRYKLNNVQETLLAVEEGTPALDRLQREALRGDPR